jgi:hypothetical protein
MKTVIEWGKKKLKTWVSKHIPATKKGNMLKTWRVIVLVILSMTMCINMKIK